LLLARLSTRGRTLAARAGRQTGTALLDHRAAPGTSAEACKSGSAHLPTATLSRVAEFDGERVRGHHPTGGFHRAYERFRVAQSVGDAIATFQALFEALNWVHAIDDYVARVWSPRGKVEGRDWRDDPALPESLAPVMDGLRYARNRVHHQWADAVIAHGGAKLPFTAPRVLMTWVWRSVDELPTGRADERGRAAYSEVLAGNSVEDALATMSETFIFLGSLLDPSIPARTPPVVAVVSE
jgi:hypothetical protein